MFDCKVDVIKKNLRPHPVDCFEKEYHEQLSLVSILSRTRHLTFRNYHENWNPKLFLECTLFVFIISVHNHTQIFV